jgi:hypothetical protein
MGDNLDLFGHLSEPQAVLVHRGRTPKPKETPLDRVMRQITELEADLAILERGIPAFRSQLQDRLQPLAERRAEFIRSFVVWLAEEWRKPRLPAGQQDRIQDLAFFLVEIGTMDSGIDLDDVLAETGFLAGEGESPEPDEEGDDDRDDLVRETLEELMRTTGLRPPPEVIEEMIRAARAHEEPAEAARDWFAEHRDERARRAPHRRRPGRPPSGDPAALDAAALKKRIYHGLARDLHPDKANDADEQRRRTELMQRLTVAYHQGDMKSLLSLLHVHGSDNLKSGLDATTEKLLLRSLADQRSSLKLRIRTVLQDLPAGVNWPATLRDPQLSQALLQRQGDAAQADLEAFCRRLAAIRQPGGLKRLLRGTRNHEWDEVF